MSKIKVLALPSDSTGVGKFRSVDPHVFLQNLYGDEFHVDIIYEPPYDDMNFWKEYQIVAFHRSITPDFDKSIQLIEKLKLKKKYLYKYKNIYIFIILKYIVYKLDNLILLDRKTLVNKTIKDITNDLSKNKEDLGIEHIDWKYYNEEKKYRIYRDGRIYSNYKKWFMNVVDNKAFNSTKCSFFISKSISFFFVYSTILLK